MQSNKDDHCCMFLIHPFLLGRSNEEKFTLQVAALILIEQGKISLDTPVSDYLSEFQHPVVVDDVAAHELTFRPANTAVTVKHLLNFSSGLFYPVKREGYDGVTEVYSSKEMHASTDPLASFFQIIMVCPMVMYISINLKSF